MGNVTIWKSALLNGSETFIRNQAEAVGAWPVVLLGASKVDSAISRESDVIVFPATPIGRLRRKMFLWCGRSRAVRRSLRESNPLLVHAHFATEGRLIRRAARSISVPYIVTAHGQDVTARLDGNSVRARIRRNRLRTTFRGAARVIAVSQFIRERVVDLGADPERVIVHHIGIPIPLVQPASYKWDIIFVGRFVEKKGILDLLSALVLLKDLAPSVALIGSGPLLARVQDEVRVRGLRVDFLGSQPPQRVAEEMAAARIFVGPSRAGVDGDSEGLGMVFLEAAAAGVPAVAYRHGGVPEAVEAGVTGVLVPEGDVPALAAAVRELLMDSDLRIRMGDAARARVEADFDVVKQTRALEAIYSGVVCGHDVRPS